MLIRNIVATIYINLKGIISNIIQKMELDLAQTLLTSFIPLFYPLLGQDLDYGQPCICVLASERPHWLVVFIRDIVKK